MGCGKSTVGSLLAKKLGREFIDLDSYIEKSEGMSIPQIFERKGEACFRKLETEALKKLGGSNGVIATGGGTLLSPENAELARTLGTVIFIDLEFRICYYRIKNDKNRPIAYNSTRSQLLARYEQRKPLYQKAASFSVSGSGSPMRIVDEILKRSEIC